LIAALSGQLIDAGGLPSCGKRASWRQLPRTRNPVRPNAADQRFLSNPAASPTGFGVSILQLCSAMIRRHGPDRGTKSRVSPNASPWAFGVKSGAVYVPDPFKHSHVRSSIPVDKRHGTYQTSLDSNRVRRYGENLPPRDGSPDQICPKCVSSAQDQALTPLKCLSAVSAPTAVEVCTYPSSNSSPRRQNCPWRPKWPIARR
jgi:hypothetical protein